MNVTVNPGFRVDLPKKSFYPGEVIPDLDDKEAKRLIDAGIVQAGGEAASGTTSGKQLLNVAQTIELVTAATTVEELDKLADGEERKGVQAAIDKRRTELAPA